MSRVPKGCVKLCELAKEVGVSSRTVAVYKKALGIDGYISVLRKKEVTDAMKRLYRTSIEAKKERCRRGTREFKLGLVPFGELAALAGCSRAVARNILRNAGWPSEIQRERISEAVAVIKETMAENARLQAQRTASGRWKSAKKRRKVSQKARKTVVLGVKTIGMEEKTIKTQVKPADWSWRVCIRGDRGWLVVRTGTKDEMTAWAAMLVDNGIMAEARKNKYGDMA